VASIDSTSKVFVDNVTTIVLEDGDADTLTIALRQAPLNYSLSGRTVVEARNAGRHAGTPIVNQTEDGNVTGNISAIVTTFYNTTNHSLQDFAKGIGTASAKNSVGTGTAHLVKMTATVTNEDSTTQTLVFNYCHFDTAELGDLDGQYLLTLSFTDFENEPTIS
jgi:hypothetical protein